MDLSGSYRRLPMYSESDADAQTATRLVHIVSATKCHDHTRLTQTPQRSLEDDGNISDALPPCTVQGFDVEFDDKRDDARKFKHGF